MRAMLQGKTTYEGGKDSPLNWWRGKGKQRRIISRIVLCRTPKRERERGTSPLRREKGKEERRPPHFREIGKETKKDEEKRETRTFTVFCTEKEKKKGPQRREKGKRKGLMFVTPKHLWEQ